jgi:hypothetical protein
MRGEGMMPFDKFTGGVIIDRYDKVIHQYKDLGGIRRYVSRVLRQDRWQIKPYMIDLYRNTDMSGTMIISFMDKRKAKFCLGSHEELVGIVKRWRNLQDCSVSECYQLDENTYQLERILRTGFAYRMRTGLQGISGEWDS